MYVCYNLIVIIHTSLLLLSGNNSSIQLILGGIIMEVLVNAIKTANEDLGTISSVVVIDDRIKVKFEDGDIVTVIKINDFNYKFGTLEANFENIEVLNSIVDEYLESLVPDYSEIVKKIGAADGFRSCIDEDTGSIVVVRDNGDRFTMDWDHNSGWFIDNCELVDLDTIVTVNEIIK